MAGVLKLAWRKELNMRPSASSLCVRGDVLVVAGKHSRLFRLDPETGEVLWAVSVGDAHGTAVVGLDAVLYLDQMGVLSCFELEDGSLRWSKQGERFSGHLSVAESCVFVGGWRDYQSLAARDLGNGRRLWRMNKDRSTSRAADLHWPHVFEDRVLVSARDSLVLEELKPRSGRAHRRWRLPAPIVSADHQTAFVPTMKGSVIFRAGSSSVVELSHDGLEEIWRAPGELGFGAPLLHAGMLWAPSANGIALVNLADASSTAVRINEGFAPGFGPDIDGVMAVSRAGSVVAIGSDGKICARGEISRRASALAHLSNGLSVVASKGGIVAVQYRCG